LACWFHQLILGISERRFPQANNHHHFQNLTSYPTGKEATAVKIIKEVIKYGTFKIEL